MYHHFLYLLLSKKNYSEPFCVPKIYHFVIAENYPKKEYMMKLYSMTWQYVIKFLTIRLVGKPIHCKWYERLWILLILFEYVNIIRYQVFSVILCYFYVYLYKFMIINRCSAAVHMAIGLDYSTEKCGLYANLSSNQSRAVG